MKLTQREKSTIECPRCGMKSLIGMESCPECGLIFSRLELATNKDAKKKILKREKDYIIYTNKLPKDIKFYKLLLLVIFTGLFGGHCFYVGRYYRGGVLLLNGIALICYAIFNAPLVLVDEGRLIAALATIGGLIMFLWVYDIFAIIFKKFKVPVTIDLDGEAQI